MGRVALAIGHKLEVVLALEVLLMAEVVELSEEVRGEGASLLAGDEQLALYLMRKGGIQPALPALLHLNISSQTGSSSH